MNEVVIISYHKEYEYGEATGTYTHVEFLPEEHLDISKLNDGDIVIYPSKIVKVSTTKTLLPYDKTNVWEE